MRFLFGGGRGLNPEPSIYYAFSIPTELSSRGQINYEINYELGISMWHIK